MKTTEERRWYDSEPAAWRKKGHLEDAEALEQLIVWAKRNPSMAAERAVLEFCKQSNWPGD